MKVYSIYLIVLTFFSSCFIFRGSAQHPECCSFDTKTLELNFSCQNEKIKRIEILALSDDPGQFSKLIERRRGDTANVIKLNSLEDSIIRRGSVLIKIWVGELIIDDYRIQVTPKEWQNKTIVYGSRNYR